MPEVRPFAGLVYDSAIAGTIALLTAPPYDAISPADHERYLRTSPHNVVRLILGDDAGAPAKDRYRRAGETLRTWRARGVLRQLDAPALYPYEFTFVHAGRERRVRGVIGEVGLEAQGTGIVPHEGTMPGPIEDRLHLLRQVRANLSPVYAMIDGPAPELAGLLEPAMREPAAADVTDESGTRHRLWVMTDGIDAVARAFHERTIMIADGHHRFAVALAYRAEMSARFGAGPWDSMMMLLVDAATERPPVLPLHRVQIGGEPPPVQGHAVRDLGELLAVLDDERLTVGVVTAHDGTIVHRARTLSGLPPTVNVLHEQVLADVSSDALRFLPDAVLAEDAVRTGTATAAYLLPSTRVEAIRAVLARGGRLPEKSTYFWPKPRTGLVIRPIDGPSN
ncbi:MAG TPA: DUF1015 domain-containing protein [Actinomycetota bacterium]